MITLLVVDDHPVVREGLVAVLENQPDFRVVGSAGTAKEGVRLAEALRPAVVLLDLQLPDTGGAAAIPRLVAASPATRVLVFTAHETEEDIREAIGAGTHGYLLKGATADEIARAVRAVNGGGLVLEPGVAARVLAQRGARPLGLSGREQEVLRRAAAGLSNKQIAAALAITERTVKFHLASVFNKLGADNRAQAVAVAIQRRLL